MSTAGTRETARRDFFTCLGIWLSLEVFVFVVLPLAGLAMVSDSLMIWFIASLVLGIGGAWLLSFGAQVLLRSRLSSDRSRRIVRWLLGQFASWLGLLGIAFPLLVMSIGIFTNVVTVLTR